VVYTNTRGGLYSSVYTNTRGGLYSSVYTNTRGDCSVVYILILEGTVQWCVY